MSTPRASIVRILVMETRTEFVKLVRLPAFVIPSLALPLLFYVFFGLALGGQRSASGTSIATYMLATYGTFGVVGAALFGLGIGVATERGQGWLLVKRASPMPPFAYFAAKVAMAMLFASVVALLLFAAGAIFGHVRLAGAQWLTLFVSLVLGAVPFCAFGCAIGAIAGPNSAPATVNLVYLPMAFASGLWLPFEMLPPVVRAIGPAMPPFHLARLALHAIGSDSSSPLMHVAALTGFSVAFLGIAIAAFRRDEGKAYG
jgi:ABC-2 type transport system permease protein